MRLDALLDCAAERAPAAPALVDGAARYSYAAWQARVAAVAGGLAGLGVEAGDRVALCLRNREELTTLHLACQRLGAITTPLNFRLAPAARSPTASATRRHAWRYTRQEHRAGDPCRPRRVGMRAGPRGRG